MKKDDSGLIEKFVSKKTVWRGNAVNFDVDTVRLPNGKLATREFMSHPGAVGVVPFLDRDTVVLVRQYRHPVGRVTLELPAGKLDARESPLACVKRELVEETGYTARKIATLIQYWPTPAFSDEVLHLYIATGLRAGRMNTDEDEFLEVVHMPFKKAVELVRRGKIRDSKTVIGLLACAVRSSR
ncbi:MAG: ADP-ribose pyrophosphatase [Elusimicrobia bacterium CG11_big_fil_rev_8_21_14_0_20_64_6]|nr:MAG: ADP-ribose pyrophosphatase [Elusimicrobia bacterium CG11_big_fil_rev_8_21_14_0_20_64_6]